MGFYDTPKGLLNYNEHLPFFADFYHLLSKINSTKRVLPGKVIMVTSAREEEGKSTLASYISITGAISSQNFYSYLLIDGDLRRASLHERFGFQRENGLSELLMKRKRLAEIIRRTSFSTLHFISAGKYVPNPFELMNVEKIQLYFEELREYYKLIVIDSPPIISVSETLELAQIVDGIILVVQAGKTTAMIIKKAIEMLKEARCNLLGVVLNDVKEVLPNYYNNKNYTNSNEKKKSK